MSLDDGFKGYSVPLSPTMVHQSSLLGPRIRMAAFLVAGAAAMISHHFFYAFLDGKAAENSASSLMDAAVHRTMTQSLANTLGNAIATVGKLCLAGTISTAFVQIFWWRMRRTGYTIRQVNRVLNYRQNPFDVTAWPSWQNAFGLSAVATASALLLALTLVVPGALTVETKSASVPCTVPTVNLSHADLTGVLSPVVDNTTVGPYYTYGNPSGKTFAFISRVLMAGSYITPPSPCGVCEYDITFVAPTVQCENVTQTVNFDETLPRTGWIYVWNTTQPFDGTPGHIPYHVKVASRNILGRSADNITDSSLDPVEALDCRGYSATYDVRVQHNLTTTITVSHIDIGEELLQLYAPDLSYFQLMTIWDAFGKQLMGTVQYLYTYNDFQPPVAWVAYSPMVAASRSIAWQWQTDMLTAIPTLMQNISISLLSDELSTERNATLSAQRTTCRITGLHFVYNRPRLLLTYAAGVAVTLVCLASGFVAVHFNGVGETMVFSRVLGAMFDLKERLATAAADVGGDLSEISLDTHLQADEEPIGRFDLKWHNITLHMYEAPV